MDRSYLSNPDVVAASRDFVCIRLATYESKEEPEFLKRIFTGRSGELENTVFTILSPDGKKKLVRAGRSPHMTFRGPEEESIREMATSMQRIAKQYRSKSKQKTLPYLADLRRGINVASCDIQPLVVTAARTNAARKKIEALLLELAWSKEFIGKFAYASVADLKQLRVVTGASQTDGVLVVQPGKYGLKATLLTQTSGTDAAKLRAALATGLKRFKPESKDSRKHIRDGHRQGVHWETEIEVTDTHGPGGPGGGRGR